jgi:hypothetical protein
MRLAVTGLFLAFSLCPRNCPADEPTAADVTNTFPSVAEVIDGRTFETTTDQNIFFLRAIHDRYASHWPDLLEANITLGDYVLSPEKFQRFVDELGEAMRDRDDPTACSNLARITSDPEFYANTNVSRPEIIRAAARALIKIGPAGQETLAAAFTPDHYGSDPASLEYLADAIGEDRPADPALAGALAATAFDFTATNGSIYPRCTTTAVKNLLCLGGGTDAVRARLKTDEVLSHPGRFQAVVEGIAADRASQLSTNLAAIQIKVREELARLTNSPGAYRDELQELDAGITQTLANFGKPREKSN